MRQTLKQWKALRDYARRPSFLGPQPKGPACVPGAPKPRTGDGR